MTMFFVNNFQNKRHKHEHRFGDQTNDLLSKEIHLHTYTNNNAMNEHQIYIYITVLYSNPQTQLPQKTTALFPHSVKKKKLCV